MGEEKVRTVVGEAPLPPAIPPPSPSVSGLGSLPLTRVATPMVPRLGPRAFFHVPDGDFRARRPVRLAFSTAESR